MSKAPMAAELNITRARMIELLNEDLAGEYQAIIAYTVYSQVIKGPEYTDIARELEVHAGEELQHAIKIAKQIDYLGGHARRDAQAGQDFKGPGRHAAGRSRERTGNGGALS